MSNILYYSNNISMELEWLKWIHANLHGIQILNQIFKYVTYLGEWAILWFTLALVLICIKKTRKMGIVLLVTVLIASGMQWVTKHIFLRPRPYSEYPAIADFVNSLGVVLPTSTSFPSGHTLVSFAAATMLTCAYKGKGAYSFIPAGLIAISRIYLCIHFPTDVLGGALIGAAVGIGSYYLCKWILGKILDRKNN